MNFWIVLEVENLWMILSEVFNGLIWKDIFFFSLASVGSFITLFFTLSAGLCWAGLESLSQMVNSLLTSRLIKVYRRDTNEPDREKLVGDLGWVSSYAQSFENKGCSLYMLNLLALLKRSWSISARSVFF